MLQGTRDLERRESFINEEARDARRTELEAQAFELHREIEELVRQKRQGHHAMSVRLARMRDDDLWQHVGVYRNFEDYAVKVGATTSPTMARQMANLANQLEQLPILRSVFADGKADWTKVREAAPAALEKPESEARWADEVQKSSFDVVRRKARMALGLPPLKRSTLDLPLDVDALWDHYRDVLGARLGRRITKVESMEHLILSAIRGESWNEVPEDERIDAVASEGEAGSEPSTPIATTTKATPSRIPAPAALLHLFECRKCAQVEVDGSLGPVPLEVGRTVTFQQDAFVQGRRGDRLADDPGEDPASGLRARPRDLRRPGLRGARLPRQPPRGRAGLEGDRPRRGPALPPLPRPSSRAPRGLARDPGDRLDRAPLVQRVGQGARRPAGLDLVARGARGASHTCAWRGARRPGDVDQDGARGDGGRRAARGRPPPAPTRRHGRRDHGRGLECPVVVPAWASTSPSSRNSGPRGEAGRHAREIVRPGEGSGKGTKARPSPGRPSTSSARRGTRVSPVPAATVWTSVLRLLAWNSWGGPARRAAHRLSA